MIKFPTLIHIAPLFFTIVENFLSGSLFHHFMRRYYGHIRMFRSYFIYICTGNQERGLRTGINTVSKIDKYGRT